MKTNYVSNLLKVAVTTVGMMSAAGQAANAFVLTQGTTINTFLECINDGVALVVGSSAAQNGWYYATDASNDSTSSTGGTEFEIYGMGIKETADSIYVSLNANTSLLGVDRNVPGGKIGWGDMFFNFSGKNFMTAMNDGDLFGVRFAGTNDSGVSDVGLYSGVTAKSVVDINNGWSSINAYNKQVGAKASLGDLTDQTDYFDKTQSLNVISSGNFLTGLTYLTNDDLVTAGYNTSQFAGSQTIAFRFSKSDFPGGAPAPASPDTIAVPEPSTMLGLTAIGLAFAGSKTRKQRAIAIKA